LCRDVHIACDQASLEAAAIAVLRPRTSCTEARNVYRANIGCDSRGLLLFPLSSECKSHNFSVRLEVGRTVAQAVSRRFSTAAARLRARIKSCTSVLTRATRRNIPEDGILQSHVGSMVDRMALGQGFSQYFGISCQSFVPLVFSTIISIYHPGLKNSPINDRINSGLCCTPAS
jgi:hypothetical protein